MFQNMELKKSVSTIAEAGQDPEKAKLLSAILAYQDMAHGQKSAIIESDNLTKNIVPLVHTYTLSPYTLHFVRRRKGKHSVHLQGFLRPQRAERQRSDTPLFFCVVNEKEMN